VPITASGGRLAGVFDGHLRGPVDKAVKPIGILLRKTGLSPDHLTILGLVVAACAGVVIGSGHLLWGLVLVILAALPDLLDGALAKASNTTSQRGAFFDSVIDRVSDAFFFGGVAWFYDGRSRHLALLPFAIMAVSSVISYMRAKAESLGLDAKGGIMERAERIVLLCIGLLLGAWWPSVLEGVLWLMMVLTVVTAIQRFVKVWKQAGVAPITAAKLAAREHRRIERKDNRKRIRTEILVRRRTPR
jgi:CDP-diacylglycerol---glycerol-3-phosphate 3-phosphatidyltransferase